MAGPGLDFETRENAKHPRFLLVKPLGYGRSTDQNLGNLSRRSRETYPERTFPAKCKAATRRLVRKIGPNGSRTATTVCEPFQPGSPASPLAGWNARKVRPMDKRLSWARIVVAIAIDWRFVLALAAFRQP